MVRGLRNHRLKSRDLSNMNIFTRLSCIVKDYYKEINPATLTGAIDVVVVCQEDGSYRSSPFHVRFGKLGVFKSKQKVVDIEINGVAVDSIHMKLGEAGEAFFVEKVLVDEDDDTFNDFDDDVITSSNQTSPIALPKTAVKFNTSSTTTSESIQIVRITGSDEVTDGAGSKPSTPSATSDFTASATTTTTITSTIEIEQSTSCLVEATSPKPQYEYPTNETNSIELGGVIISNVTDMPLSNESSPSSSKSLETVATAAASTATTANVDITADKKSTKPNYFSDGDLTPDLLSSPDVSRPSTPKSDTELDVLKNKKEFDEWYWKWGKLPQRELHAAALAAQKKQTEEQANGTRESKKGGSFTEMITSLISTTKPKPNEIEGGVYLGDTDKLDSEVAALYINQKNSYKPISQSVKDDDQESGKGQSVSQSPTKEYSILGDVQISLCGFAASQEANFEDLFQQSSVMYDRFMDEIGTITSNPNLVIKLNGRYMNWASAAPIILASTVYHKPLTNETINQIVETNMTGSSGKGVAKKPTATVAPTTAQPQQQQQASAGVTPSAQQQKSWKFWGKKPTSANTSTSIQGQASQPSQQVQQPVSVYRNKQNPDQFEEDEITLIDEQSTTPTPTPTLVDLKNDFPDSQQQQQKRQLPFGKKEVYRKTTRLSSELISKLNLKPGANEISYSVTTAYQGTTRIDSYIFLWSYDDKVIVSDIDGTITKSDVWGHVLPMLGRDWTQAGVADLYSAIEKNSYRFMYLSARAIGQSKLTRDLLRNINQDGFTLPEGPLLVTPTSLFTAFHKEVIEKKPQEFKISCLEDIKSLFPKDRNPLYAGYGNRTNDVLAYKTVGIPMSRIFTINPRGELKHEVSQTFQSSYSKLCDYVDQIFPPIKPTLNHLVAEYSSFNYWKDPLPEVQLPDNVELAVVTQLSKSGKTKTPPTTPPIAITPKSSSITNLKDDAQSSGLKTDDKQKSVSDLTKDVDFDLLSKSL